MTEHNPSSFALAAEAGERRFRRARKDHRCAHARIAERGNNERVAAVCRRTIAKGELYLEGDPDPYYAGGFGHDRYCMACAEAGLA